MLGGAYDFLNRVLEFGALNEFEKLVCNFLLFVSSPSSLGTSPLDDSAARPAQEWGHYENARYFSESAEATLGSTGHQDRKFGMARHLRAGGLLHMARADSQRPLAFVDN